MRFCIVGFLFAIFQAKGLFAYDESPSGFLFPPALGKGATWVADGEDYQVFFTNPALLSRFRHRQISSLETTAVFSTDLAGLARYVDEAAYRYNDWDQLTDEEKIDLIMQTRNNISRFHPRVALFSNLGSVISPLPNGHGVWGTGFFYGYDAKARFHFNFQIQQFSTTEEVVRYIVRDAYVEINRDTLVPISYAREWTWDRFVPGFWAGGATLKFLRRRQFRRSFLELEDYSDSRRLAYADGFGIGLDWGLICKAKPKLTYGFSILDFLGTHVRYNAVPADGDFPGQPSHTGTIEPRVNFGAHYIPFQLFGWLPGETLSVSAELQDIFNRSYPLSFDNVLDVDEGVIRHLFVGVEWKFFRLRFRTGFSQRRPTLGFGLEGDPIRFEYAFASRRDDIRPGDGAERTHNISLGLKWGPSPAVINQNYREVQVTKPSEPLAGNPDWNTRRATRRVYIVKEGDTFKSISKQQYGRLELWKLIFYANLENVKETEDLVPGTKLEIPIN